MRAGQFNELKPDPKGSKVLNLFGSDIVQCLKSFEDQHDKAARARTNDHRECVYVSFGCILNLVQWGVPEYGMEEGDDLRRRNESVRKQRSQALPAQQEEGPTRRTAA